MDILTSNLFFIANRFTSTVLYQFRKARLLIACSDDEDALSAFDEYFGFIESADIENENGATPLEYVCIAKTDDKRVVKT